MGSIDSVWKLIENGKSGKNIGIKTGLQKLDSIIGGIQPSRYYLIGAASSVGKTAFALYLMYNMLKKATEDKPIYFLYFSLEIGEDVLLTKLMGLYCAEEFGIYLTTNQILSFETPLKEEYFQYLEKAKVWLMDRMKYLEILDIGVNARTMYKEVYKFATRFGDLSEVDGRKIYTPHNPKQQIIVMIDHLNLSRQEDGRSLKQEIDLLSSYAVTLKRALKVSFFMLMQQNRESSSMDRRKADLSEPTINDLKDTATPAQDADVVVQLFSPHREQLASYRGYKIKGEFGLEDTFRSLIINKNRYGIANIVMGMSFYGIVGWFNELPMSKDITDFVKYKQPGTNIPNKSKVADNKGGDTPKETVYEF